MDITRELIQLVNRNRLKSILPLGSEELSDSLLMKLYDGIYDGEFADDDAAHRSLYGEEVDRSTYIKLKYDLREKLKQTLLFLPVSHTGMTNEDQREALAECNRCIALVALLFLQRAFQAMEQVAVKGLRIALHYEYTSETISLARSLLNLQVGEHYRRRRFKKLTVIIQENIELLALESIAQNFYLKLSALYWVKRPPHRKILKLTTVALKQLEYQMNLTAKPTLRTHFMRDCLQMAHALAEKNLPEALKTGRDSLVRINNHSYFDGVAYRTIAFQVIMCHTQLKQFTESSALIKEAYAAVAPRSFNELQLRQLEVINSFHQLNFEHAWQVYHATTKHRSFGKFPIEVREIWELIKAWLLVLNHYREDIVKGDLKVSKLMNDLGIMSRDKSGLNIPVIVVAFLLFTRMKDYRGAMELAESLKQYRYRYVMDDYNARSKIFLDMLLLLPDNRFEHDEVARAALPFVKKLAKLPSELVGQDHDIEIVPYEVAWETVLQALRDRTDYLSQSV